jgi:hypothetical protein
MNKLKWILLLTSLACMVSKLYSQCSFEKYFPYTNTLNGNIYKTSDNYLIVAADGTTDSNDPRNGQIDCIAIKMDTCGNIIWQDTYGHPVETDEMSGGFTETDNEDYIFIGNAAFQAKEGINIRFYKTNKDGKMLSNKLYNKYTAGARLVVKNGFKKNSFFVGGFVTNGGFSNTEPYLMEIDENGNIIRDKVFYFPVYSESKYLRKILQLNNNSMYVFMQLNYDSLVVANIDSNFNVRWVKIPASDTIQNIKSYNDACFSYDSTSIAVLGSFFEFRNPNIFIRDNWVSYVKTDLNLNYQKVNGVKQEDMYGGYLFIRPTPENGYIVSNSRIDSNLNLTKIDTFYTLDGEQIFDYWIPNGNKSFYGFARGARPTDPFTIILVAKTDQDGRVNIIKPKPTLPLKIYPNPAKDILNIEISEEGKTYTVEIIDMLSKTILTRQIAGTSTLNIENLTNGFYSVNLTDNTGKVSVNKLLIAK